MFGSGRLVYCIGLKRLAYILFLVFLSSRVFATHIVGGGFDVQYLGGDSYQITLRVLRDCRNGRADFNTSAFIGIYDKFNHSKKTTIELTFIKKETLPFVSPKCGGSSIECTEMGTYQKTVTLSSSIYTSTAGYYVSWERCCRNHIISNIVDPGSASQAFYAEIPRNTIRNSTPRFTNNPVTLLCTNSLFKYNFKFTDADGDSLRYSLTNPLNGNLGPQNPNGEGGQGYPLVMSGPYSPVIWNMGFNANAAINGNPPLNINMKTGEVSVNPTNEGTYVASILVEEFRNGVKIGEVRLELQFQVIQCAQNIAPLITQTDTLDSLIARTYFQVQVPNRLCFDIRSTDEKDSLVMDVEFPPSIKFLSNQPQVSKHIEGNKKIVNRFCWQTDCEMNSLQQVPFNVMVTDNGCPMPRTSASQFVVVIAPMQTQPPPQFSCLEVKPGQTVLSWNDTNQSPYHKSYKIYKGINDSNYTLLAEVGKSVRTYTDNNTPNNGYTDWDNERTFAINYTYFIISTNLCDVEGNPSDTIGSLSSLPAITQNDSLNPVMVKDTFEVMVSETICFGIAASDPGDSLTMHIRSDIFTNTSLPGARPVVDTLVWGRDKVATTFCWSPDCEIYKFNSKHIVEFDVYVHDLACPVGNISKRKMWVKLKPLPVQGSVDLLCMTLSEPDKVYLYYGDSTPATYFSYYLVYRGIDYKNYAIIDTIWQKDQRMFTDHMAANQANINYSYYFIGVNKCGMEGPPSDTLSTFEEQEYIPRKQSLFTVTVTDNKKVTVLWNPSTEKDFAKYYLYKAKNVPGKKFEQIATLEHLMDTFYIDEDVEVDKQSYCYHLVMRDTCDNIGPNGKEACSILLKGVANDMEHDLNWNHYIGWNNGVKEYEMKRRFVKDVYRSLVFVDSTRHLDHDFDYDQGAYNYYVTAYENDDDAGNPGIAESISNEIYLYQPPHVYLPNAFSRNGDKINDSWGWKYSFVKDFDVKIFNRWGEMVFQSNNPKSNWDGTYGGKVVPADVYVYVVTFSGWDSVQYTKRGNFTILE